MTLSRTYADEVIDALTQSVRLLSYDQTVRLLGCSVQEVRKVVGSLAEQGIVSVEPHLVYVLGRAKSPVCTWNPGEIAPDFGAMAYQLRNRQSHSVELDLILPTALACKRFGGTRVRPRSSDWTHDLWTSEIYVYYQHRLQYEPDFVWTSGDTLRSDNETQLFSGCLPDACLRSVSGSVVKIVEAGGVGYGKSKLAAMHRHYEFCSYEIW